MDVRVARVEMLDPALEPGRVAQVGGGEPIVEGGGDRAQVGFAAALVGVGEPSGAGQGHRAGEEADGDERDQRDERAQPRVWHTRSLSAPRGRMVERAPTVGSPAPVPTRVLILSWEYPPIVEGGLARHVRKLAEGSSVAGSRCTCWRAAAAAWRRSRTVTA